MEQPPVRLSKYLAQRGLCSRREADRYIEQGLVRVDGQVVTDAWFRVTPTHSVEMDASATRRQAALLTAVLNKPLGYVSGQPEKGYQSAATLIRPSNWAGTGDPPKVRDRHTLAPAGRLDINSTGLLILSQDGRVARQLIGNDARVEKEYLVRFSGDVTEPQLARLRKGLELDGRRLRPAKVTRLNQQQLRFELVEGRKRQIRRMCDLVGVEVRALKRVRIGDIRLADLAPGKWRLLEPGELPE